MDLRWRRVIVYSTSSTSSCSCSSYSCARITVVCYTAESLLNVLIHHRFISIFPPTTHTHTHTQGHATEFTAKSPSVYCVLRLLSSPFLMELCSKRLFNNNIPFQLSFNGKRARINGNSYSNPSSSSSLSSSFFFFFTPKEATKNHTKIVVRRTFKTKRTPITLM